MGKIKGETNSNLTSWEKKMAKAKNIKNKLKKRIRIERWKPNPYFKKERYNLDFYLRTPFIIHKEKYFSL